MFELPEAKRIRRNEILSPSSSTRSSPEIPADDEEARAKLERLLAFDTFTPDTNQDAESENIAHNHEDEAANDDEEQEFEFRLFSALSKTTTADASSKSGKHKPDNEDIPGDDIKTQKLKIRLRSPTPVDVPLGEGRFVVPFRGWDYYFTKPELMHISTHDPARLEAEEANRRRQFEDIAVTGAEVLHWAQTEKTPGCHLPWRVMHLNPKAHKVPKSLLRESTQMTTTTSLVAAAETMKKSNPGKKRRIILRTRAAKVAAAATAAAATANMSEAEKRNKKNREKKIRKRQREREKKAALAASNGGDVVVPDAEDADSSD